MHYQIPPGLNGLTKEELTASREEFGFNEIKATGKDAWYLVLAELLKDPMLILLISVSLIYLFLGEYAEAAFMAVAIIAVSAISFYQDKRSKKALAELEKLNEAMTTVIRDSTAQRIPTREIAVGDLCITEEGQLINADGVILHSNDFSVNESSLTGEAHSLFKNAESEDNRIFSGTMSLSGLAIFKVEKIGKETELGKINESIQSITSSVSPLQIQISKFVRAMALIGVSVFLAICFYNYAKTGDFTDSLLLGLTLAMSVLPEEIPVAFTTFMALGAWKLMKEGVIIKRSNIVETLGSTTVICTDKTGTITENSMLLKYLYHFGSDKSYDSSHFSDEQLSELITYAMWASEPLPFDPMEKAIHLSYSETTKTDIRSDFKMVHEYPLEGVPPMMTHFFENNSGQRIIAAKGAPEAILSVSALSDTERIRLEEKIIEYGKQGYRVLGVAKSTYTGDTFPKKQQELPFEFLGFTVFYDPPKEGISEVFRAIYRAGIKVKVITGDNSETTKSIAHKAGIIHSEVAVNGEQITNCSSIQLSETVRKTNLFTRMFPRAKLTVINELKRQGEIVAMLGDGVNDAPALKAAHIGVAMGNKGTEIAKAAASLIITNDNLDKLIIGIAAGRRIYSNLKKAIQYIISIHIPIILTVSLPLFLGWAYPEIFSPVHVIFLELVMGPTCSIVYENEPMEKNIMLQRPRKMSSTFLSGRELIISILQGLFITASVLFAYQWSVREGGNEESTRAIVFATLIFSNVFLSFSNRSFHYSIFETFRNRNPLLLIITAAVILCFLAINYIEPATSFFKVSTLSLREIAVALLLAMLSIVWFELYKLAKRSMRQKNIVH